MPDIRTTGVSVRVATLDVEETEIANGRIDGYVLATYRHVYTSSEG